MLRTTAERRSNDLDRDLQGLASDRYVLSYEIPGTVSGTMPHQAAEPPVRGG
jgi:hypothetical protein